MKILIIDLTESNCFVALSKDSYTYKLSKEAKKTKIEHVFNLIEKLLKIADLELSKLDYLATITGPGSFTGVRMGVSVTQAISRIHDLPIIGISSLNALALSARNICGKNKIYVATDAKRNLVYHAVYQFDETNHSSTAIVKDRLSKPKDLLIEYDRETAFVGSAWDSYFRNKKEHSNSTNLISISSPDADSLVHLAIEKIKLKEIQSAHSIRPIYLSHPVD